MENAHFGCDFRQKNEKKTHPNYKNEKLTDLLVLSIYSRALSTLIF